MKPRPRTGPGGIMLYPVEFATSQMRFREGDAFTAMCQELASIPSLSYFVDEHLDVLDAPRLCVLLDEPSRTATRASMAIAVAAELSRRDRRVIIIDGDDHLPDLSGWAGRVDREGWIDMIRYGFSLEATSRTIFPDDDHVRFMGVGSYAPTRVTAGELTRLLEVLEDEADIVLVSVSAGDRGAVWSGLPSLRIVCWDPDEQSVESIDGLVQDAAMLGSYPAAILTFSTPVVEEPEKPAWPEEIRRPSSQGEVRQSSPVFRRLAMTMAALVVLIGAWWMLLPLLNGSEDVAEPASVSMGSQDFTRAQDEIVYEDSPVTYPDPTADAVVAEVEPELESNISEDTISEPEVQSPPETMLVEQDPFQREVGDQGWCLHIFSYRSESRLVRGERMMENLGFRHAVLETSDEKGLLFRVYTGSFPSRSAAKAALPEALERLDTSWGQAVRASAIR